MQTNISKYFYAALFFTFAISCERGSRPITDSSHLTIQLTNADAELLRLSQQQDGLTVLCDHSSDLRLKANIATTNNGSIKMEVRYHDNLPATVSEGSNCRLSAVVDTSHKSFEGFTWKEGSKGILYQTVFTKVQDAQIKATAIEGFQNLTKDESIIEQNTQKLEINISNLDEEVIKNHKFFMTCNDGDTILSPNNVEINEAIASVDFFIKNENQGVSCNLIQIFSNNDLSTIVGTITLPEVVLPTSDTIKGLEVSISAKSTNTQEPILSRSISGPWFARVSVSGSSDTFVVYSPNNQKTFTELNIDNIKTGLNSDDNSLKLIKVSSLNELKSRALPSINALIDSLAISKEDLEDFSITSIHQVYKYDLQELNPSKLEEGHSFKSLQWFGVVSTDTASTGFYYDLIFHPNNTNMMSTGEQSYTSDEDIKRNLSFDPAINVIGQRWHDTNPEAENNCHIDWVFADIQIELDFIDAKYDWKNSTNPAEASCGLVADDFTDIALDAEINVASIWAWTWQKVSP